MTKHTLSHSATVTPSQEPALDINGVLADRALQLSETTYAELRGLLPLVQLRVRQKGPATIFMVKGSRPSTRVVIYPFRYWVLFKMTMAFNRVIHIFGFHTLVQTEEWNPDTGEVLQIGFGCLICPYHEVEQ